MNSLITFNTGYTQSLPSKKYDTWIDAYTYAYTNKSPIIVETSVGTFYVKGNQTTDYDFCKKILKRNVKEGFKPKSQCRLIKW
tara:strand:- start:395 stop:643 length:249 start_codon:yes stop_codon:yes gene_type:complete